jgi:hypothetical protein
MSARKNFSSEIEIMNRAELFAEAKSRGFTAKRTNTNDELRSIIKKDIKKKQQNKKYRDFRDLFEEYENQANNFDNSILQQRQEPGDQIEVIERVQRPRAGDNEILKEFEDELKVHDLQQREELEKFNKEKREKREQQR